MYILLFILVASLFYLGYEYLKRKNSNSKELEITQLQTSKSVEVNDTTKKMEVKEALDNMNKKIEIKEVGSNRHRPVRIDEVGNNRFDNQADYLVPDEEYKDTNDSNIYNISEDFLLNPFASGYDGDEDTMLLDSSEDTVVLNINPSLMSNTFVYLIDKDENVETKILMKKDKVLIGRLKNYVDFYIELRQISRRHACIQKREGEFCIEDLGSKNGTYINGYELEVGKLYRLRDEDLITFGSKDFIFKTDMY